MPDTLELIREVRARIRTTGDTGAVADNDIAIWLWEEEKRVAALIKKHAPRYFNEAFTFNTTVNRVEYRLPENVSNGITDVMVSDPTTTPPTLQPLTYRPYQDYVRFGLQSTGLRDPRSVGIWYLRERNAIGIMPYTSALTIQVNYDRTLPELSYGLAQGAFAAGTLNLMGTPTVGRTRREPNYYEGATFIITGGTGIGLTNVCSAYNGTTMSCTMVQNWDTTPDATSQYSVHIEIPEDFHAGLVEGACARFYESEVDWTAANFFRGLAEKTYQDVRQRLFPVQRQDVPRIRQTAMEAYPRRVVF